jgi:RNA polymerase sigma-70 factor (ECF subfamily)
MALRVFVVRYERAVFALLSRMLGRSAEVEDLAQDTFLRAIGALPRFDPEGPARVSTWLLTIAMRLALDRMKKRVPMPSADLEWVAAEQGSPEGETSRAELRRAIALAVEGLPHDQRAAFVLAEFQEFSIAEIAEALSVPEATVKTRLFRAREKLGRALSDFGGERG